MKRWILLTGLLFCCYHSNAQLDTVVIVQTTEDCGAYPYRTIAKGKLGGGYIDSVRVCKQLVQWDSSAYYLIVYSPDSIIVLEGEFLGEFANGPLKKYDRWGRLIFDGEYKYVSPKRTNLNAYSIEIGTKKIISYKNYTSTTPNEILEVVYEPDSKKYRSRLYDKDGNVTWEKFGKRKYYF